MYAALMPPHELHPYTEAEVAKVSPESGVYVLYQIQVPLHAGGGDNLRDALTAACPEFPGASHFAIEVHSNPRDIEARVNELRQQFRRVRTSAFVG